MKKWWKSKTIWFNAAIAAGTSLAGAVGVDVGALANAIIPIIAACNVLLRGATKEPLG